MKKDKKILIKIMCGLADMAYSSDLDKKGLKNLSKHYYNKMKNYLKD